MPYTGTPPLLKTRIIYTKYTLKVQTKTVFEYPYWLRIFPPVTGRPIPYFLSER